jgi:hypothetical protein
MRSELGRRVLEGQRQMLKVQRRLFDNTFQALSALQNQQQSVIDRFVDSSRVPDEAREIVDAWREAAAQQRRQFRHAVEESFNSFDHLLGRLAEGQGSAPAEPKAGAPRAVAKKATSKKQAAKKPAAKKPATKKKTVKKKAAPSRKKASKKKT